MPKTFFQKIDYHILEILKIKKFMLIRLCSSSKYFFSKWTLNHQMSWDVFIHWLKFFSWYTQVLSEMFMGNLQMSFSLFVTFNCNHSTSVSKVSSIAVVQNPFQIWAHPGKDGRVSIIWTAKLENPRCDSNQDFFTIDGCCQWTWNALWIKSKEAIS